MEADTMSDDSGHVNRGLDVDGVQVDGARLRLSRNEDIERIPDDATGEGDRQYAAAVNQIRKDRGAQIVSDERESQPRNEKEERRRRREEERRRRVPIATEAEIAALRDEPDRNVCTLPVCCNNIRVFCAFVSAIFLLHGILTKYTTEILPHLGRRYPISQLELEFITGVEKIGFIITLLFVAFFGNRMNKVSAISAGSFLTAVGSVVMATPYFIYGSNLNENNPSGISDYVYSGLCARNGTLTQCEALNLEESRTGPFSLFCIAQFIIGIGAALYSSLGLVYLEDNAKSKESPLMLGIALASHAVGSFLGIPLAQWFTSLPEDASGKNLVTVEGEDVGAWWLGYPILASVSLLLGTCTIWFPDWFLVPDWLKRRRFKKRLLRYRRKKRVISRKRRKEEIKRLKKERKARKRRQSRRGSRQSRASHHRDDRRRDRRRSDNPSRRPTRNRANRENENSENPPPYSRSNNVQDPVPDVVPAQNGDLAPEREAQRDSYHSDDTATENMANTAEEERRRKEREKRKRRQRRQEKRKKRYRRIVLRTERLEDLPRSLIKLVKNPILLSSVLGSALATFLLTGYTTELPTYLRLQFQSSTNTASIAASFAGPVAMAVGTLAGAVYVFKWQPTLARASLVTLIALGISTILLPVMFAFRCNLDPVVPIEQEGLNSRFDCNGICDCLNSQLHFVHGSDGETSWTFASPCHAGCKDVKIDGDEYVYRNCSCVPNNGRVFTGVASTDCNLLIPASLFVFVIVMLCSVGVVPAVTIFMRYGRDKKRSLVLGYALWMIYLLGYVPSAPIYRSLRSDRCNMWKEDCHDGEVCWSYNLTQYRYAVNGAAVAFHALATLVFGYNFYKLRKRRPSSDPNTIEDAQYDNPMIRQGNLGEASADFELQNETERNIRSERNLEGLNGTSF